MNFRFADNQVLFALKQDRAAGALPSLAGVSRGKNLPKSEVMEFRINSSFMRSRTGFNLEEAVV